MRRLVGRDVLGAPRAGGRARCAHGDVHAARTGTFRGRGPPGTSAPTTNAPWPPCARAAPAGERDARLVGRDVLGAPRAGGRARCAHGERPRCAHGDVPGTRAAGDVGPYHKRPVAAMRPCRPGGGARCAAGRARRPRRAARRGTRTLRARRRPGGRGPPGPRAAGDVGPYHKRPRVRHAPVPPRRGNGMRRLVGRDVLGAPRAGGRARCAHGDVPGTRAAGDVGPYHAISRQRMVIPEISMYPAGTVSW